MPLIFQIVLLLFLPLAFAWLISLCGLLVAGCGRAVRNARAARPGGLPRPPQHLH